MHSMSETFRFLTILEILKMIECQSGTGNVRGIKFSFQMLCSTFEVSEVCQAHEILYVMNQIAIYIHL